MVEVPPELTDHESKIVTVFHDESMFNDNEDQWYCCLDKDD